MLPRVIGVFPGGSSPSVYQAGEVGHRSAKQRFVTVATFEHAHDTTLGPLVGEFTDIVRETIEKRGWNSPIVSGHRRRFMLRGIKSSAEHPTSKSGVQ